MKKLFTVLFATIALIGCTEKRTLYVYNWQDYIDPEIVDSFSKKYDCQVVIDSFDDNEGMVAKMMSGSSGYDIIFPSTYIIPVLVRNKLIQKIDINRLPTVKDNFDSSYNRFLLFTNMQWSIPYAFSMTGIAYRKDKVGKVTDSWNMLLEPGNTVSILKDVREILGIGLILNGYSVNSTNGMELMKAVNTMLDFKNKSLKIDSVQYKSGLLNGEFNAAMGYNSDSLQLNSSEDNANIGFFIPKEGSTCCFDEMAIPVGGKSEELAYLFIDFLYTKESANKNAEYICSVIPNKTVTSNRVDEKVLDRLHLITDIGDAIGVYSKMWDKFLTNSSK